MRKILGAGQDEFGGRDVAGIEVHRPCDVLESPRQIRLHRVGRQLDRRQVVGGDQALEGQELPPQPLTHLPAVVVGEVEGEDLAFDVRGAESLGER